MVLGSHPAVYRGYFLALSSGFAPSGLRGPDEVLGIEPRSSVCKTSALPAVLLLQMSAVKLESYEVQAHF